jgi:hypothetical protein
MLTNDSVRTTSLLGSKLHTLHYSITKLIVYSLHPVMENGHVSSRLALTNPSAFSIPVSVLFPFSSLFLHVYSQASKIYSMRTLPWLQEVRGYNFFVHQSIAMRIDRGITRIRSYTALRRYRRSSLKIERMYVQRECTIIFWCVCLKRGQALAPARGLIVQAYQLLNVIKDI